MIDVYFENRRVIASGCVRAGVQGDNKCESVHFHLPRLGEGQSERLYLVSGDEGDTVTLVNGIWAPDATATAAGTSLSAYAEIVLGDTVWHSEPFNIEIVGIPNASEALTRAYPSAVQDMMDAIDALYDNLGAVGADNDLCAAEAARVTAESARISAERGRTAAELQRAAAESLRVTAETARVDAETARATGEQTRAAAELVRASAEAARVTAEQARVTAEQGRAALGLSTTDGKLCVEVVRE